uniref:Uncharacterized protein n=1 Tax=Solanum tuberosum TaxID=4113 RepID=M1DNG7_SOLTU
MDTTWQEGTRQLKKMMKACRLSSSVDESWIGLEIAFCSNAMSPEGKGQVGDEMEQSCFRLAREKGRKTKTTKLIAGGIGSIWVQLERVNPSPSPTHSARESEWANAEVVLKAATRCSRETESIRGECRGIVNTDKAEITSLQIKTRKITVRQYISRGVKRINRETHTEHHEQTCITVNKTKLHSLAMSAYRKFQLQKMMPSSQVRRVDAETEEEIIYELDCEHLEISMSASAGKKKIILVNEEEEKID